MTPTKPSPGIRGIDPAKLPGEGEAHPAELPNMQAHYQN